jgi:hypothetical protein
MKKIIYSTIICLFFITSNYAQTYSGGNGTAASPYLISSKADMATLAMVVNGGTNYSGKHFRLTQNLIEITTRIGNSSANSFCGTFDGGGYSIDVSTVSGYAGVFGCISGATIKNLGVIGNISSSSSYAGGICGYAMNSTISNCYATGDVSSSSYSSSYAGGICGYAMNSTINNCYATGDISSSSSSYSYSSDSYSYAGGICGYASTVTNCFAANTNIISKYGNLNASPGRIVASAKSIEICYALSSMLLNNATVSSQSPASRNGKDENLSSFQSQAWIEDNLFTWDFTDIWYIPNGSAAFPVIKKTPMINLTLSSDIVTYGDLQPISVTAISNNNTIPIVYTSSNNEIAEVAENTLTVTIKKAGTVFIIASQSDGNGFRAEKDSVSLVINKKELTVTANSMSMTYGDNPAQYTCRYEGFVFNETVNVLKKLPAFNCDATSSSNAGNYTITPLGAEADSYSFVYKTGVLSITKRILRVIPDNISRTYGYDNPAFTFSYDGFVNGNTSSVISTKPTVTTAATRYSNAGIYDIECSGGLATNYSFTYEKGLLTVTKAPLNIIANSLYRYYGSDNPQFTIYYSGFRNSDTEAVLSSQPQLFCSATKNSDAGTYPINISENLTALNYEISYTTGFLQIYKVMLTAKADDKTRYAGKANPEFTITYTGFVNGENEMLLDVLPQAICNANPESAPGTYPIYVNGGSDNNYEFNRQYGMLTILQSTGIEETFPDPFSVYPNPATEQMVITGMAGANVTVVDLQGHIVHQQSNIRPEEIIAVSTWAKGVYLVRLQNGNKRITHKLLIH